MFYSGFGDESATSLSIPGFLIFSLARSYECGCLVGYRIYSHLGGGDVSVLVLGDTSLTMRFEREQEGDPELHRRLE